MKTVIKTVLVAAMAIGSAASVNGLMAANPAMQKAFSQMLSEGAAGRGAALGNFVNGAQMSNPGFQAQALAIFNAQVQNLAADDLVGHQQAAVTALSSALGKDAKTAEFATAVRNVMDSYLQANITEESVVQDVAGIIGASATGSFTNTASVCSGNVMDAHNQDISMVDAPTLRLVGDAIDAAERVYSEAQQAYPEAFRTDAAAAARAFASQEKDLRVANGMTVVSDAYTSVLAAGGFDINGDGVISGEKEIASDSSKAWELATVYKLPADLASNPGFTAAERVALGESICSSCAGSDQLPVNVDLSSISCKAAA